MWHLAWQNVIHKKVRALASVGGVAFSILLMFMQLGIFSAAEKSADVVFDGVDFDVALTSTQYVFLANPGRLPREVLWRARDVMGVEKVYPFHVSFALLRSVDDGLPRGLLLMGVDVDNVPFRDPEIRAQAGKLTIPDSALVDRVARGEYGRRDVGVQTDLGAGRIDIVGQYTLGTGFVAGADAIVSDHTFTRIVPSAWVDHPNLAFITLNPRTDRRQAAEQLRRLMPAGVRVLTRDEIIAVERNYFVNIKPIGIMFRAGVVVGFLVGAVTLYQILSTQVTNHLKELATLKAMGYTDHRVNLLVVLEGFIYAFLGYLPAHAGAELLYYILRQGAMVPVWMTTGRALMVLGLTLLMCLVSSVLAARRVRSADPADLFG
jgi:putative ABC transport system permease protein